MAHFAELNKDNIVLRVIVVSNDDCLDAEGNESELIGRAFCERLLGGRWIQTSYNNRIRKQYAGIGYQYDELNDVFIAPSPYPSWILDANFDWQAPTPKPSYPAFWDEDSLSWVELPSN